jgi:ABC-type uncharacterized transport system auxiliary subunit
MTRRPFPALPVLALALSVLLALGGCVSLNVGSEPVPQLQLALRDAGAATTVRRASPLVPALLIQPQPSTALADTLAIAYTRRDQAFEFYQYASWVERPVRQLPRLLQQRLEARGVAGAVGMVGDPLRADWLLAVAIDHLYHDARSDPGSVQLALSVDLFDRRSHSRVSHRTISVALPTAHNDSATAAQAMSLAVAQSFDELLPWLEQALQQAKPAARP